MRCIYWCLEALSLLRHETLCSQLFARGIQSLRITGLMNQVNCIVITIFLNRTIRTSKCDAHSELYLKYEHSGAIIKIFWLTSLFVVWLSIRNLFILWEKIPRVHPSICFYDFRTERLKQNYIFKLWDI